MIRVEPGSTVSRVVAAGLLLALVSASASLVLAPGIKARTAVEAALAQQKLLRTHLDQLGARAASPAMQVPDAEPLLLKAASPALAAAVLQARLDAAIADAGARLEQLQTETAIEGQEPAPDHVRATASFGATTAQLSQILFAVETGRPLIIVDKLVVQAQSQTDEMHDEGLRVELTGRSMVVR